MLRNLCLRFILGCLVFAASNMRISSLQAQQHDLLSSDKLLKYGTKTVSVGGAGAFGLVMFFVAAEFLHADEKSLVKYPLAILSASIIAILSEKILTKVFEKITPLERLHITENIFVAVGNVIDSVENELKKEETVNDNNRRQELTKVLNAAKYLVGVVLNEAGDQGLYASLKTKGISLEKHIDAMMLKVVAADNLGEPIIVS